jgi:hypothetical protein
MKHTALASAMSLSLVAPPTFAAQAAAATLIVNPSIATPGAKVAATGTGFPTFGGNQIRIVVGQTVVATVAYQPPNFSATFLAPKLPAGTYPVTACVASAGTCSSAPGTSASAQLKILAPPPRTTAPPPPSGPGDLRITADPLCCDPPATSSPLDLREHAAPAPGPGLKNPGPPPNFPDLYVLGIEVTQNIQDLSSRMPLVAGRKTWIRVHPRANIGSWAPIDGAILVKRGSQQEILYPVNGPISTGLTVDRADADSALNFVLDPKWYAEGALNISALVWAFGPGTLDDKEPNPENNLMKTAVTFKAAKNPNVHVVPLDDGAGPGPSPSLLWVISSSLFVSNNIIRYHPIADTNLTVYPVPLGPASNGNGGGIGTVPAWDLSTSTGRTQPLQRLFWYHQVLGIPSDERLFGLFDSSIPSGGYTGWAKSNLKSAWTMPSGSTPSHEAGHLTGLNHVDCSGSEADGGALDATHPNARPHCSLAPTGTAGYFGLTVYDTPFTIYSNDPAHPQAGYPLMGYKSPKWNDAYHWCKMLTYYEVPCSPEAIGVPGIPIPHPTNIDVNCDKSVTGPGGIALKICLADPGTVVPAKPQAWLLVTGTLSKNGGVITQAALVDKLAPSLAALVAEDEAALQPGRGGQNELVVQDAAGATIARVKVGELGSAAELAAPSIAHGDGGKETAVAEFAKVVPIAGQIASIKLLAGAKVMAAKQLSAAPPAIGNLSAGPEGDGVRIKWNVSDPDGDSVTSTVLWSANGTAWLPVAMDTTVNSILIGSGVQMPGGPAVRIKVIANDGVRTSESVSAPFSVGAKAPTVAIGGLPDGSTIPRYFLGDLTALGYDPEDGQLSGTAIFWRSNLDGELGTGTAFSLRKFSPGEHAITATATDSSGETGIDTIHLIVVDTGAPALRRQGAVPDAERRLLAGKAVAPRLTWLWLAFAVVGLVVALTGAGLLLRRRRLRSRLA